MLRMAEEILFKAEGGCIPWPEKRAHIMPDLQSKGGFGAFKLVQGGSASMTAKWL